MSIKAHNFRIGLFVLSGAALLVVALFAIGLRAYFGKHDIIETYVTGKVENLSVGALVKLRGVTIGKVSSIDFAGTEYPSYKEQYVVIQFEVPRGTVWSAETNNVQKLIDAEVALGLRARVQGQGAYWCKSPSRWSMWTRSFIPLSQSLGLLNTITFRRRWASSPGSWRRWKKH